MRFSTQLPVLAALVATASAVDIQAWQGSGCDNGASVYWSNVAAYTCVTIPLSFGIRFTNVPAGGVGQVYYDSHCTNFAQGGGKGTYCLDAHNNLRSTNWFYSSSKLMMRETVTGEMTSGIMYTTTEGVTRRIAANPSQFEEILALTKAEDWDALAAYPEDLNPGPEKRDETTSPL